MAECISAPTCSLYEVITLILLCDDRDLHYVSWHMT